MVPTAPHFYISILDYELEVIPLNRSLVSKQLIDDYQMLSNYIEGKTVKKIIACTENQIALLMEGGFVIRFLQLEDELIFDIELCSKSG